MDSTSVYGLELLDLEGTGGKAIATDHRVLSKREGRTGRILARSLDSTDLAQRGLYKLDRGPIFSQYGPEQTWLIGDLKIFHKFYVTICGKCAG